jgi:hypothetical protein
MEGHILAEGQLKVSTRDDCFYQKKQKADLSACLETLSQETGFKY